MAIECSYVSLPKGISFHAGGKPTRMRMTEVLIMLNQPGRIGSTHGLWYSQRWQTSVSSDMSPRLCLSSEATEIGILKRLRLPLNVDLCEAAKHKPWALPRRSGRFSAYVFPCEGLKVDQSKSRNPSKSAGWPSSSNICKTQRFDWFLSHFDRHYE